MDQGQVMEQLWKGVNGTRVAPHRQLPPFLPLWGMQDSDFWLYSCTSYRVICYPIKKKSCRGPGSFPSLCLSTPALKVLPLLERRNSWTEHQGSPAWICIWEATQTNLCETRNRIACRHEPEPGVKPMDKFSKHVTTTSATWEVYIWIQFVICTIKKNPQKVI